MSFDVRRKFPSLFHFIDLADSRFDYNAVDESTGAKKPREEWILQEVNFGVDLDSRIGILGPNGE